MPELPEVETIKVGLSKKIIGKTIKDIEIETKKSFQGEKSEVVGAKVSEIIRRAKTIRLKLSNGKNLLIHLKMTGQLIFIDKKKRFAGGHPSHDWHDKLPNNHTRITFIFEDDSKLFFNDLRKFGWAKVLSDKEIEETFSSFGPEPFSKGFTAGYLEKLTKRFPKKPIKQLIMDQSLIAGVGNIYADESLFMAKIMPRTTAGKLTEKEITNLYSAIIEILKMGIKFGGTTDSDYVDSEGKKGGMQDHLNVYHRTGEDCSCGGTIERIKLGGRGTNYCPECQKEKK